MVTEKTLALYCLVPPQFFLVPVLEGIKINRIIKHVTVLTKGVGLGEQCHG